MERKIIKFITLFMLVGILCCTNISAVWASDTSDITEATDLETDLDSSEDTVYSVLRGTNLNYGTTKVSKLASNKVGVSGITQCHHACDTVYLELYLERKVNGSYSVYKSWSFTTNNATHLTKSLKVIVPSGYYYRVRGYHAAKDGSKESVTTVTKGVLKKKKKIIL